MKHIRFTIASLLVVILVLGVGFAALRESSDLWESGLFTLTLGILLISILAAIHRTEKRRAFWLGFAVFGWIYLALTFMPSIESRLITTKVLAYLDSKVPDRSIVHIKRVWDSWSSKPDQNNQSIGFVPQGNSGTSRTVPVAGKLSFMGSFTGAASGSTMTFIRIGHSFLTLIAAMMGGLLSQHLDAKERERSRESVSPTVLSS
jgi:hypothetical protein